MSVGFGFSAGDFIAAIELVGTVVDALRSSGSAGAEYRELVSQLLSLESALIQVKRLEFEESRYAEVIALRQAAAQCQRTIDAFWVKIRKYQPALGGTRSSSKVKGGWMKIKWALCKKEDVAKFKTDLVAHTESIQLLLVMVQMCKTNIGEKKQEDRRKSLTGRIQEGYFSVMQRLMVVVGQGKQLLDITSSILQTNVKVFQIVLQIQQMITKIPGQVERQQPVYMIDALGRHSPFHLEFVRSAEALVAVLKVNFKKHGNGAEKVEKGEFVIEDEVTGRDIDLTADWELCFSPGQRVEMSIIVTEIPATFDKTVANFSPTRATTLPYRATAALKPHTQEQITGPNYRSSLLPSKRRLERYDFENLAVYWNVRFRYDGSSGQLPAATKWSWGRTWVEDLGAGNFEARKCRLCPWWFWDSDGRSQHEKYHRRLVRRRVRIRRR